MTEMTREEQAREWDELFGPIAPAKPIDPTPRLVNGYYTLYAEGCYREMLERKLQYAFPTGTIAQRRGMSTLGQLVRSAGRALDVRDPQFWSREMVTALKTQHMPDASDADLELFIEVAKQSGLNPIRVPPQIWAIPYPDPQTKKPRYKPCISIDGLRQRAAHQGLLRDVDGPFWCGGQDGKWQEVWIGNEPPYAAKFKITKPDGGSVTAVVYWDSFKRQHYNNPAPWGFSKDKNTNARKFVSPGAAAQQLGKCAEAACIRKLLPHLPKDSVIDVEYGIDSDAAPEDTEQRASTERIQTVMFTEEEQDETPPAEDETPPPTDDDEEPVPTHSTAQILERFKAAVPDQQERVAYMREHYGQVVFGRLNAAQQNKLAQDLNLFATDTTEEESE